MKLTISILFCVILTLQYNGVDGKLKNFFEKIHGSVHGAADKVKEDLNNFFHPDANKQQENQNESSNIHFVESEENTDAAAAAKRPVEVTPTTSTTQTPAVTDPSSFNATTLAPSTTTKDGRENFDGGCLTGFMRTPDGRCKPTF
ncbi:hypothetical protein PYW08_015372 [Mythimna loreyi]|uniref:Uncharacterized protein n=1 Tax=Mythimna loreyi TaxID=667449 RepID=A0ACC2QXG1_9NEOP|nr:hypothetical protein PYW08_015372 [Mythimna loreyi]